MKTKLILSFFLFQIALTFNVFGQTSCTLNVTKQVTSPTCPGGSDATVTLTNQSTTPGNPATCQATPNTPLSGENCSSCKISVTSSVTNISVNNGDKVCIPAGVTFTGNVDINNGTLVICGTANIGSLNYNAGNIIVLGTATLSNLNSNMNNSASVFKNYGTVNANNFTFNGRVENHGNFYILGDFNINANTAIFINTGTIKSASNAVSSSFNNNSSAASTNRGTIDFKTNIKNNGTSLFYNYCIVKAGGDIHNDGTYHLYGNMQAGLEFKFNSGATFNIYDKAYIKTNKVFMASRINRTGCSLIEITDYSNINSALVFGGSGELRICDKNGIIEEKTYSGAINLSCSFCGVANLTATWPDGSSGTVKTGLSAGTYIVKVSDGTCTKDITVVVDPTKLSFDVLAVAPTSSGSCTGSASLTNIDARKPYTIRWYKGTTLIKTAVDTDANTGITSQCAASYSVEITDAKGCKLSKPFMISDQSNKDCKIPISAKLISSKNPSCNPVSPDGEIEILAKGGVGALTIIWNNASKTSGSKVTGLTKGDYTATISDSKGCIFPFSTSLFDPAFSIGLAFDVNGDGSNCLAVANAYVSGENGPFTVSWTGPGYSKTGFTADRLCKGDYVLTATDTKGCVKSLPVSVDSSNIALKLKASNVVMPGCGTNINKGSITLNVEGGRAPISYEWQGLPSTAVVSANSVTGLTAGNYRVYIRDFKGQTIVQDYHLTNVFEQHFPLVTVSGNAGVAVAKLTYNTSVSLTNIIWYKGDVQLSAGATLTSVPNLAKGLYTVALIDGATCKSSFSFEVKDTNIPEFPTCLIPVTITDKLIQLPSCNPSTASDGKIEITAGGGDGSYTYLWNNPAATATALLPNAQANVSYTITVTDKSGLCKATKTYKLLPASSLIVMNVLATGDGKNCKGLAEATVANAKEPFTIVWKNLTTNVTKTTTNSVTITGDLCEGKYSASLTDAAGCVAVRNFVVPGSTPPVYVEMENISTKQPTCAKLDGAISFTLKNAPAGTTIQWTGPGTLYSNATSQSGLGKGDYSVLITTPDGQSLNEIFSLKEPQELNIPTVNVEGIPGSAKATAIFSSPLSSYILKWSKGGVEFASGVSLSVGNLSKGFYNLSYTDMLTGCSVSVPFEVKDQNTSFCGADKGLPDNSLCKWPLYANASRKVLPSCNAATPDGLMEVVPGGGMGKLTLTWSNGVTGPTISNINSGTYTLTIKDEACCQQTFPFTLDPANSNLAVTAQVKKENGAQCEGIAEATIVKPGTGPLTYVWKKTTAPTATLSSVTKDVSGLCTADYLLEVTDAKGCKASDVFKITDKITPVECAAFTVEETGRIPVSCKDGKGTIEVLAKNGVGPYVYTWQKSGVTVATGTSLKDAVEGTYILTVTSASCPPFEKTFELKKELTNLSICVGSTAPVQGCDGKAVLNTSNLPANLESVTWMKNNNVIAQGKGTSVSGLCTGNYSVIVKDAGGCQVSLQFKIGTTNSTICSSVPPNDVCIYPVLLSVLEKVNPSCSPGKDGKLTVSATGGSSALKYSWTDDATVLSGSRTKLDAGSYTLKVQDQLGVCKAETTLVLLPSSGSVNVQNEVTPETEVCNGAIELKPDPGQVLTFKWLSAPASTSLKLSSLCAGPQLVELRQGSCYSLHTIHVPHITPPCETTVDATIKPATSQTGGGSIELSLDKCQKNCALDLALTGMDENCSGQVPSPIACTKSVSGNQALVIAAGEKVCVKPGTSLSGSVSMNGGELVNEGTITLTSLTNSLGTSIYNKGYLSTPTLNVTGKFVNEGQVDLQGLNVDGKLFNCAIISVTGVMDINAAGEVLNNGQLVVQTLNNNNKLTNNSNLTVTTGQLNSGKFINNGRAEFDNLSVNNQTLTNNKYLKVKTSFRGNQAVIDIAGCCSQTELNSPANVVTINNLTGNCTTAPSTSTGTGTGTETTEVCQKPVLIIKTTTTTLTNLVKLQGPMDYYGPCNLQGLTLDPCVKCTTSVCTTPPPCLDCIVTWSNGLTGKIITDLKPGCYKATITCPGTPSFERTYCVKPFEPLKVTGIKPTVICGTTNATLKVEYKDGAAPYTIEWTGPGITSVNKNLETITVTQPGIYRATVTDGTKASDYKEFDLAFSNSISITNVLRSNPYIGKSNGWIQVFASGDNLKYSWLNYPDVTGNELTGLAKGSYKVTISDYANICVAETTVVLNEDFTECPDFYVDNVSGIATSCPGAADGRAIFTVHGASDFTVSPDPEKLTAGLHTLTFRTVLNGKNCTAIAPVLIPAGTLACPKPCDLDISIVPTHIACPKGSTGDIMLSITTESDSYNLKWDHIPAGQTQPEHLSNLAEGTYGFTVSLPDVKDCVIPLSQTITAPADLRIYVDANADLTICPGKSIKFSSNYFTDISWEKDGVNMSFDSQFEATLPGVYTLKHKLFPICPNMTSSVTITAGTDCINPERERSPLCDPVEVTPRPENDDCTYQLQNAALTSAKQRYKAYTDSVALAFSNLYVAKCLESQDKLTMKYEDGEYHRTLYYYDQAGNLVRTIPPKGVELLKTTDELAQVKLDRMNGTHIQETKHTLASTYTYNSLNQLTGQNIPDHDPIQYRAIDDTYGIGLGGVNVAGVSMSGSNGFLVGNQGTEGKIFTTEDGGKNWTQATAFNIGKLNDVRWIDANNAIAVGEKGVFLKTQNNDIESWKPHATGTLKELSFTRITSGGKFVVYTASGEHWISTSSSADEWVEMPVAVFQQNSANDKVISDMFRNSNDWYMSVTSASELTAKNDVFEIYKLRSDNTETTDLWEKVSTFNISYNEVRAQSFAGNLGYMVLEGKRFLKTTDKGQSWKYLATQLDKELIALHAFNESELFAVTIDGTLIESEDGGITWINPGSQITLDNGDKVSGIFTLPYLNSLNREKGILRVLNNPNKFYLFTDYLSGKLTKISPALNSGENVTTITYLKDMEYVAVGTNKSRVLVWTKSNNSWKDYTAISGTTAPLDYTCTGTDLKTPVYSQASPVRSLHIRKETNNNLLITALLGDAKGVFNFSSTTVIKNCVSNVDITSSWIHFKDDQAGWTDGTLESFSPYAEDKLVGFALSGTSYNLWKGSLSGYDWDISAGSTLALQTGVKPDMLDQTSIGFYHVPDASNGYFAYTLGESGVNLTIAGGLKSDNATLPVMPTLAHDGTKLVVAGKNGLVANLTGTTWTLAAQPFNKFDGVDLAVKTTGEIQLLGTQPLTSSGFEKVIYNLSGTTWTKQISPALAFDINTIAERQVTDLIVIGGKEWLPVHHNFKPLVNLFGTDLIVEGASYKALSVGELGQIFLIDGTSGHAEWEQINTLSPVSLFGLNMISSTTGYAVGNEGTVTYTSDAGKNWSFIPSGTSKDLKAVNFYNANLGVIGGQAGTLRLTESAGADNFNKDLTLATAGDITSILFADATTAYATGSLGIVKISKSGNVWNKSLVPATSGFWNNLFKVNSKLMVAVGSGNKILEIALPAGTITAKNLLIDEGNPQTPPVSPATAENILAVNYTDDITGYISTESGKVYKTINAGEYWQQISPNPDLPPVTGSPLRNISFTGEGRFLATGDGGKVEKIADETFRFTSRYWYDELGRMIVSQTAEQFDGKQTQKVNNVETQIRKNSFSYTLYDGLGRIKETGEMRNSPTDPRDLAPAGLPSQILYADLENFITANANKRYDVTQMGYTDGLIGLPAGFVQENLRPRVAYSRYFPVLTSSVALPLHTSHYSYDIHGNVKTLLQQYNLSTTTGTLFKRLDYEYDLVSGKVNKAIFQQDQSDQFIHKYGYDADNRITDVETSRDGIHWSKDARYEYYRHGPLARTEMGDGVQGMDYAYTIQGWVKAVNSATLQTSRDIGQDGLSNSSNRETARDAFGFSLGYFDNDYKPIGSVIAASSPVMANPFGGVQRSSDPTPQLLTGSALYNGNISYMTTAVRQFMQGTNAGPQTYAFQYDQLNRMTDAQAYKSGSADVTANSIAAGNKTENYRMKLTYDPNGNIETLARNNDKGVLLDNMDYEFYGDDYKTNGTRRTNRLKKIIETGDKVNGVKEQIAVENYDYDRVGNLIEDKSENIAEIEWTASGKVSKVRKTDGTTIEFGYSSTGERIYKNDGKKLTLYTRDATGNTMATFQQDLVTTGNPVQPQEFDMYGNSRLGLVHANHQTTTGEKTEELKGLREYELTNHLGNVQATVADYKQGAGTGTSVEYFDAITLTAIDYYPFGMEMPERNYKGMTNYRYSFNGQENFYDGNTSISFDERIYNPGTAVWMSLDGASSHYPSHTPYGFTLQNPIANKELNGDVIETGWDVFNVALDIASLGANLATGNYVDAAIDAGGLIYDAAATIVPGLPGGAGVIIKASRAGKAAIKVVEAIKVGNRAFQSAVKAEKYRAVLTKFKNSSKLADAFWDAGKGGANKLAKALGTAGTGKAAHHLVPTELLEKNEFVQKAVKEGFDFNGVVNGIALDATRHSGGHANYTEFVGEQINNAFKSAKNKGRSATDILTDVANDLKKTINNTKGKIDELGK